MKETVKISENLDLKARELNFVHDVNQNEDIRQLHLGIHANSTNSVRKLSYFLLSCQHNIETFDRDRY